MNHTNKDQELVDYINSLERASQYLLSLIEASRDPLFAISTTGKIMDVNEASVLATGVSKQQLIGSAFVGYFTNPKQAKIGYDLVFSEGFVTAFPLTIKDHKLTDVLFNGAIYKDENGKPLVQ